MQHRNATYEQIGNLSLMQQRKKLGHSLEQRIRMHSGLLVFCEVKHEGMANNIAYMERVVHGPGALGYKH